MAKEEDVDKLRKKLIKDNQAMFQGIAKSLQGSSDKQIAKEQDRYFDKLTKQALEERKKQALERQAERDKIRIEEIKNDLKTKQGLTDAVAETLAKSANEREKREEKNATGMKKMFVSLKKGFQSFQRTPEEKKEEAARQGGFLGALKGMLAGKGDAMGKGAKGMFGGIMKTIKKVFSVLQIKFLLIAGFVAFAISKLKIKDLKKMWEAFTEGLAAVWKFLKPIVAYLATWIEESVLPNLVDFFVDTFKSIAEMFGKITERFSGWSDMSLWEKVQAIFGALFDFGETIMNIAGNLIAKVAAMFGIEGKWFKDLWTSFKNIPSAFMDKIMGMEQAVADKFNEWMPDGIGTFLWEKVFNPFKEWFTTLFDFSSIRTTIESLINIAYIVPNTIKKYLLDPAVKWIGEELGFDTSSFTDFNIGQLVMKAVTKAIEWIENKFDFKFPTFEMPSPGDMFKGMVPGKDNTLAWKFLPDALYNMVYGQQKPKEDKKATLKKEIAGLNETISKGKGTFNWSIEDEKEELAAAEEKLAKMEADELAIKMKKIKFKIKKIDRLISSNPFKQDKIDELNAKIDADSQKDAITSQLSKKQNKVLGRTAPTSAGQVSPNQNQGIDWKFISDKEGGSKTDGYVPNPEGSKSGVTIATGFDLGARNIKDLQGLPASLKTKLAPFLGLQGMVASEALKNRGGLYISEQEAGLIDKMSKGEAVKKLKREWNKNAKIMKGKKFEDLTGAQKTIAASVAFQYGSLSKAPRFRNAAQSGNWEGAAGELDNFGDAYGSRRASEAAYLRNDSGNRLGTAHQESVRLASNANNGPPVVISKGGDTTSNSNTQVIQAKNPRNNSAFTQAEIKTT